MHQFPASQDSIEHVVFGSTSRFDWILFTLVMKIQANFSINPNSKVIVHHTLLIHLVPIVNIRMCKTVLSNCKGHSGFFSKYSFHPETSRVRRVALKNCKNFDEFWMFWHKIDSFKAKISIFTLKNLQIIQISPVLSSVKSNSECFGMKRMLRKHSTVDPRKLTVEESSPWLESLERTGHQLKLKQPLRRVLFQQSDQDLYLRTWNMHSYHYMKHAQVFNVLVTYYLSVLLYRGFHPGFLSLRKKITSWNYHLQNWQFNVDN